MTNCGNAKIIMNNDSLLKKRTCIVKKNHFDRIFAIVVFRVSHTFEDLSLFF